MLYFTRFLNIFILWIGFSWILFIDYIVFHETELVKDLCTLFDGLMKMGLSLMDALYKTDSAKLF